MNPLLRDALVGAGVGLVAGAVFRSPQLGATVGAVLWPAYQARQRKLLGTSTAGLGAAADPYLAAHAKLRAMGSWSEGTPVRAAWQAVNAVRAALNKAASETPAKADYYRGEMKKAAYKLLSNTVPDIFKRGVGYLGDAPAAKKWLQLIAREYYYAVEAPAAGKVTAPSGRSSTASFTPEDSAAAPSPVSTASADAPSFLATYRWPLLGGGALFLAALGWALWPRRSAATA